MSELSAYNPSPDPFREPHYPSRMYKMRPLAALMPPLPGLARPKTYAPSPVWRDSTTAEVKFQPIARKKAIKLFHQARRFERQTRQPGRQDGALGRNGLAVLHALIFDELDFATGELDPAISRIARKACISVRSAARGLANLKLAGVVNWIRRSKPVEMAQGFLLKQLTNAYALLPVSQWRGFFERKEAPPPHPATWGATPPLPDQLTQALADRRAGDSPKAVLSRLADDPADTVARAIASFFGHVFAANP